MAVALDTDLTTMSFPIFKKEVTPEGDLLVYGRVTDASVDSDDQIVDADWSAKALDTWLASGGNVRVQHQAQRDPAGRGVSLDLHKDDGGHYLTAEVVEPVAKRLVEKGVLRAFSVGIFRPQILTHNKASRGIIKGGDIGEVSLVDRPANKNCVFQLVKAASDGLPEFTGKMFGEEETITKALTPTPADLARIVSSAQPQQGSIPTSAFADPVANKLNDAINEDNIIEKMAAAEDTAYALLETEVDKKHRDFSMSERKLHAKEGNALPDGSYPIPDKDALRRAAILARSGHGNVSAARSLIARRAREMGVSNPLDKKKDATKGEGMPEDAVTTDAGIPDAEKGDMCSTCKNKGTIRGGSVTCPACKGKNSSSDDASKSATDPDNDGDDDSTAAGDTDHDYWTADGKQKKPLPGEDKADKAKKPVPDPDTATGKDPKAHSEPAGKDVVDSSPSDGHATGRGGRSYQGNKSVKKSRCCSECGCMAVKSAAYCSGCGAEFTGKAKAKKKPSGTPIAGARAKDAVPAPSGPVDERDHELNSMGWPGKGSPSPEGSAIMSGSGTMSTGDGNSTSMGRKGVPAPYSLARAHDAFCAAFDAETVLNEYPSLKSIRDALNLDELRDAAGAALIGKDYELSEAYLGIARAGEDIVKAEQEVLDDARAALHKNFTSMYPSVHLSPGSITPGQFSRPYISSGHASMSAEPMGPQPPASEPPPAPDASHFRRAALTSGHQAKSPGDTQDAARSAPSPGFGKAGAKMSAEAGMRRIHDHISGIYPDLCPMNAASTPAPQAAGLKKGEELEVTINGTSLTKEDLLKAIADRAISAEEIYAALGEGNVSPDMPVRKSAKLVKVAKAAEPAEDITEKLESFQEDFLAKMQALLEPAFGKIGDLENQVNQLGAQPDPVQAPNRGIVTNTAGVSSGGAMPAERRSLVDEAALKARDEKLQFLRSLASSGDPVMREQAHDQISKMLA